MSNINEYKRLAEEFNKESAMKNLNLHCEVTGLGLDVTNIKTGRVKSITDFHNSNTTQLEKFFNECKKMMK